MRKYATDDDKVALNQHIQALAEKNANTDVYGLIKDIEHRIAWELYRISRVVDDGNFHILLEDNSVHSITLLHNIPVCCKVSLEGQQPPLHLKLSGVEKSDHFSVYGSYKDIEPSAESRDVQAYAPLWRGELLRFHGNKSGGRAGGKIFLAKYLYLTFKSAIGA